MVMANKLNKQPLKLVQLGSEELVEFDPVKGLQTLMETRDQIRHVTTALGQKSNEEAVEKLANSFGVEMDDKMREDARKSVSNQLIAHTIAERVLAQLASGKDQKEIEEDLK